MLNKYLMKENANLQRKMGVCGWVYGAFQGSVSVPKLCSLVTRTQSMVSRTVILESLSRLLEMQSQTHP